MSDQTNKPAAGLGTFNVQAGGTLTVNVFTDGIDSRNSFLIRVMIDSSAGTTNGDPDMWYVLQDGINAGRGTLTPFSVTFNDPIPANYAIYARVYPGLSTRGGETCEGITYKPGSRVDNRNFTWTNVFHDVAYSNAGERQHVSLFRVQVGLGGPVFPGTREDTIAFLGIPKPPAPPAPAPTKR